MAGDSNSNSSSNSKAPEEESPTSISKVEAKSPPSESQLPPPPSDSNSESDSKSQSSPPPPYSDSSPPPPPPSFPPPPPSPPPKIDNNDDDNNNGDDKSSPSPPPPPPDNSSNSPTPPPPDSNNSSEASPTPSPPPSSPPPPTPSSDQASTNAANSGGEASLPPSAAEQSPPALRGNGGIPVVPAAPVVVPSTPTTSAFSPPASPGSSQSSSQSRPSLASDGSGGGHPSSSSFSSPSKMSSSPPVGIIAGVVVAGVLFLLLVVVFISLRKKKKKKMTGMSPPPAMAPYGWEGAIGPQGNQYWRTPPQGHGVNITPPGPGGPPMASSEDYSGQHSGSSMTLNHGVSPGGYGLGINNKSTFTYEELAAATNGFDQSNMLGQGGFGYVHKGLLPDGKVIAVKSLKSGSGQGEREFQAEVEIISRVHHRYLVSLVGYCIAHGQRMLVYEFLPNNTLEYHLHNKVDPILEFPTRVRIALGSAKGLAYLHEDCHPRIIHRDIKASNILLDENFEAKVADFGLAKLTTDTNTHVSTRVMGTFGYLAPEYASSGKLTEKSDVFSFGVMLLELITGCRPVDPNNMQYMEDSLVDWSRPLLSKALETGKYDEFVDPRLEGNYNPQEMQRMVACAAASVRHSAKKRPKMSQIVRVLEGDVSLEALNEGTKTGQSSAYASSDGGSEYDTRAYSADMKKFRQIAFASQDFASSEYGGSTSDYGLDPSSSSSSENSREMKL